MKNKYTNLILDEDINYIKLKIKNELKKLEGSRILLTGGAGFLGYYFINLFQNIEKHSDYQPIKLVVLDNFIRGKPSWISKIKENKYFKVINTDITKFKLLNKYHFDYIMHAASIASPTFYRKFPLETINVNVNGLWRLLDYAKLKKNSHNKIHNILFFSSSEIYGDPSSKNIPTNEDYRGFVSSIGPRACYDESKRLGETLCVNYVNEYNLKISITRPFNNYGPGLNISDKRVIPDFANNIILNKNIKLFSNGESTRSFCYITDAIIGYLKILVNGKAGDVYNIGNDDQEISILNLAKEMVKISKKLFRYKGKIIYKKSNEKSYLVDNPQRRKPDITKARKNLNFLPEIDLSSGLKKSLLWYKENR